jgi:hypothetical protein
MAAPLAPTFTPAADAGEPYASFSSSASVSIASSGSTTIYYTLDGSDPRTHGLVYSGALTITANTTVSAVGVGSNLIGPVAKQDFLLKG